jgi:uncharacterized protein
VTSTGSTSSPGFEMRTSAAQERAYASVRVPTEGTILTVMRKMAETVALEMARLPAEDQRLTELDQGRQDELLAQLLERAIEAGERAVRKTPEQLPALREAGVVDAGGYAVTIIFAGVVAALRGTEAPEVERHVAPARVTHPEHESSTFRYCVNFAVTGDGLDADAWLPQLEALGDSVLVVGDAHTLRVHVHADDPEAPRRLFEGAGEVSRVEVADMHEQVTERLERLAEGSARRCMVLAVVAGAGLVDLFQREHARVIDGGRTLNPSTEEILAGIHEVPAEEVVLLPNSPNVVMAAERAAELSEKEVVVVPTRSQQAGLAVLLPFDPDASATDNAAAMAEELELVRTGGVAPAGRDDTQGRFRIGEAVGYVDDELVAWGEPVETLQAVFDRLATDAEQIQVIAADDAPLAEADVVALAPDGIELDPQRGGQPAWWWLLSAA